MTRTRWQTCGHYGVDILKIEYIAQFRACAIDIAVLADDITRMVGWAEWPLYPTMNIYHWKPLYCETNVIKRFHDIILVIILVTHRPLWLISDTFMLTDFRNKYPYSFMKRQIIELLRLREISLTRCCYRSTDMTDGISHHVSNVINNPTPSFIFVLFKVVQTRFHSYAFRIITFE